MPEKVKDISLIVAIVILAVATYAGTLNHELVWDDIGIVRYIDSVVQEGGFPTLVTSQFATHSGEDYISGYYRPVAVVSLWFDSALAASYPWTYHLTNILLHALNSVLVYFLLRLLCVRSAAAIGSMIFAVHPVHTESVAFVSGRTDLWAAVFVLLGVIAWVRERKGVSPVPSRDLFRGCIAFFMACLSKEVAFLLPAVLLVWEWITPAFRQGEESGWWSRNRRWVIGWTVTLVGVLLLRYMVFGFDLGLLQSRAGPDAPGAGASSLLMIGPMILVYLKLLVFPWPLRVYYGPADLQVTAAVALGVILFLSLALFTYFRCGKDRSMHGLVWIFFFIIPVLIAEARGGALLAERFLYLPSVGFCLMAGALAAGLAVDRRAVAIVIGLLVALMMAGSMKQGTIWKNEVTLFEEFVRIAPGEAGGHFNLGNAYAAGGRQNDAVRAYRKVIDADSGHHRAFFNMGNSLSALKSYGEAAQAYRRALAIEPDLIPGYINLGVALAEQGKYAESTIVYREGIRRSPGDYRLHLGLTISLLRGGDRQSALDHLKALEKEDRTMAEVIRGLVLDGEIED